MNENSQRMRQELSSGEWIKREVGYDGCMGGRICSNKGGRESSGKGVAKGVQLGLTEGR